MRGSTQPAAFHSVRSSAAKVNGLKQQQQQQPEDESIKNSLDRIETKDSASSFGSVRSTVKTAQDLSKSQPSITVINRQPGSGQQQSDSSSSSHVASMRHLTIAKNEVVLSADEINYIKEIGIKICLVNSVTNVPNDGKASTLKRRFAQMEKWLQRMKDPVDGIHFMDRRKFFEVSPSCAPGSEILDWINDRCKPFNRTEAKQIMQLMVDHGYLCPLETQNFEVNEGQDSMYTYQTEYFYPSRFWEVSDLDYAIYLVRRSSKNSGPLVMNSIETDRFNEFQEKFESEWRNVVIGAEKQKAFHHSLDKKDKHLFELRELAFWRAHKPLISHSATLMAHKMEKVLRKKQVQEKAYESNIAADKNKSLQYWTKKVQYLQGMVNMYRRESSASCSALIKLCEARLVVDPILIDSQSVNPWFKSETEYWPPVDTTAVPKQERVYLWTTSFRDLIADPLGLQYFHRFMEKCLAVENLDFYTECLELDFLQDLRMYYAKCHVIFNRFIAYSSPNEININASLRNQIIEKMELATPETLDIDIFADAINHVYTLMFKDRFPKFIQSEEIKQLLEGYQLPPRRRQSNMPDSETSSSDLSSLTSQKSLPRIPMSSSCTGSLHSLGSPTASLGLNNNRSGHQPQQHKASGSPVRSDSESDIDFKSQRRVSNDRFIRKSSTGGGDVQSLQKRYNGASGSLSQMNEDDYPSFN